MAVMRFTVHLTKRSTLCLRVIPNARHFWFASTFVSTAQCFRFSGLHCSLLNARYIYRSLNVSLG